MIIIYIAFGLLYFTTLTLACYVQYKSLQIMLPEFWEY